MKTKLQSLLLLVTMLFANMMQAQEWTAFEKSLPEPWMQAANDYLGISADVDNDYAVIGASGYSSKTGRVYVIHYNGNEWEKVAILTASDGVPEDEFGCSVAIDGDYIVVGGGMNNDSGAVYIFKKPTDGWKDMTETEKIAGIDREGLGNSVDIEGNTIVAGAVWATLADTKTNNGKAYIYENNGTKWEKSAELTSSDTVAYNYIGSSISISGNVIAVGAKGVNSNKGAVYIYEKPTDGWKDTTESATLKSSVGYYYLGISVNINGNYLIAESMYRSYPYDGYVHIFEKQGSNWTDTTETIYFSTKGSSTSLYINDSIAIAGGDYYDYYGSVNIYKRNKESGVWSKKALITPADPTFSGYMGSAIAYNGKSLIIGSRQVPTDVGLLSGAIYIIDKPESGWVDTSINKTILPTPYLNAALSNYGYQITLFKDYALVGESGKSKFTLLHKTDKWNRVADFYAPKDSLVTSFGESEVVASDSIIVIGETSYDNYTGAAFIYEGDITKWKDSISEATIITSSQDGSRFGNSVDIYGKTIVVGEQSKNRAYVFQKKNDNWVNVATLSPSDSTSSSSDYFGASVAIYDSIIAIGATYNSTTTNRAGAVYIFKEPISGWCDTTETALLATDVSTQMGGSVDVNEDIVVAGSRYGTFVFVKPESGWISTTTHSAELKRDNDRFYESKVKIYKDTIATTFLYEGVYLFSKPSTGWSGDISSYLFSDDTTLIRRGYGRSLGFYGNNLAVGADDDFEAGTYAGAVFFYQRNTTVSFFEQPEDIVGCPCSTTTISAKALNTTDYQWQVSTDNGNTFLDLADDDTYSDVTESELKIKLTVDMVGYKFRCIASNPEFSDTSAMASLLPDDIAPVLEVQNVTVLLNENGEVSIMATDVITSTTDNCSIKDTSLSKTLFTMDNLGDNTVDVTVTDCSGNSTTKSIIVTVTKYTTAITSSVGNNIQVYPNPATNYLTINTSDDNISKIEIVDITGQKVLEQQGNLQNVVNLNIDNLNKGVYFVRITLTQSTTRVARFMKK